MISKEQWQTIEKNLSDRIFHKESFTLDGHTILVSKTFVSKNKLGIAVYIDGVIQMAQAEQSRPEFNQVTHKVWRKRQKAVYSPVKVKKLIKDLGKRRAKEFFPNLEKVITYYDPTFTSATSLVRQFKKLDGLSVVNQTE